LYKGFAFSISYILGFYS